MELRDSWEPFRQQLNRGLWPVYLHGPNGTGKSFLAALAYCHYPRLAKWFRWCDFIADAITLEKNGEIVRYVNDVAVEITKASFWNTVERVGLLIVDEIGTGTPNEWRNELLWKLLEVRKQRPLIVTGNLHPPDLSTQFDARIQSRFCEGQFYGVKGADQRRQGLETRVRVT